MTATGRVAFNGRFAGARATGVQRVARNLIEAVDRRAPIDGGLQAEIVVPRGLNHGLRLDAIGVREIGRLRGVAWEQLELGGDRRSANLVNLCNAAPLARESAATMIHDAQVFLTPTSYSPQFAQWYRFSLPRIAQRSRLVLTVSNYSRRMLASFGICPEERIRVVYNGADHILAVRPRPEIVKRLDLDGSSYAVVFGSLQDHKNLGVLLEAWCDPALADLRLVIVGDLSEETIVRKFGKAPPKGAVVAGRLADGELRGLLESAVCLLFPSKSEGFGLPPLEAMSIGCPAIVAPEAAMPEVCGSAVLYADAHDPLAWVDAIQHLAGDSGLRAAMVEVGRAHARGFTWDAGARQLSGYLKDVVG